MTLRQLSSLCGLPAIRIATQTGWLFEGVSLPLTLYRINEGGLSANVAAQYEQWRRILGRLDREHPELIAEFGSYARAYQLRYLARRALRGRDPETAARLLRRALCTEPRILLSEPVKTLTTLVSNIAQKIFTKSAYEGVEHNLRYFFGAMQRLSSPPRHPVSGRGVYP